MINFMKYKTLYFIFSLLFIIPGLYFLIFHGFKPSIDFTGGSLLELSINPTHVSEVTVPLLQDIARQGFPINTVQQTGANTFLFQGQDLTQDLNQKFQQKINEFVGEPTEISFQQLGPTLGQELITKTIFGVILAAGFILFYVTSAFKDKKYGICAILAMLHDTIILLGTFSFLGVKMGVEVDSLFVTAVLIILSFSVHDTIVVYDRIRESLKLNPNLDFTSVVNKAVTETLSRSINNSMTIIFMLLSLFLLGGETIKWFVLALLVGTIAGTYSSTFTAAPLLVVWEQIKKKNRLSRPLA